MNVSYLSVDSAVQGVGRSQVTPVVNRLASHGLSVRLVSCESSVRSARVSSRGILNEAIEYIPIPLGEGGAVSLPGRLTRLRRAIGEPDLIHCRSDQPVLAVLGRKSPLVWDSRSFWAEQKVATGLMAPNGASFRLAETVECLAARRADGMLALSASGLQAMKDKWTHLPPLSEVVPTLVDCAHFGFSPWDSSGPVKVMFSGSYNAFYDLRLAAAFLRALSPFVETQVVWTSEGLYDPDRLCPVKVNSFVQNSYEELPRVLASGHFGMAICKPNAGRSLKMAMPTKIGEFLSTGRPVVVNRGLGDMDALIDEWRVGVSVPSGSVDELENSAMELAMLLKDDETPLRCRALAEAHFSLDSGVDRVLALYRRVLRG